MSLLDLIVGVTGSALSVATGVGIMHNLLSKKIQEVHVLVNSQLQTVLARVDQLTEALDQAEIPVPPRLVR